MQGRQGPGDRSQDPRDRSSTSAFRLSELTGRQPAIPSRPPGRARIDPPPTSRVSRPTRPAPPKPKRLGRRILVWLVALVIGGILVGAVAYGVTQFFVALSVSAGSATTAQEFLSSLKHADYDQAYSYLDATITLQITKSDFKQMAQADDNCYGKVTDFNEVEGSAVTSNNGNTQSFAFSISRGKLTQAYQLHLTFHKDASGNWSITNYGHDLGPASATCGK